LVLDFELVPLLAPDEGDPEVGRDVPDGPLEVVPLRCPDGKEVGPVPIDPFVDPFPDTGAPRKVVVVIVRFASVTVVVRFAIRVVSTVVIVVERVTKSVVTIVTVIEGIVTVSVTAEGQELDADIAGSSVHVSIELGPPPQKPRNGMMLRRNRRNHIAGGSWWTPPQYNRDWPNLD
jgi:hypothetical protein